jgi:hypothetical protein
VRPGNFSTFFDHSNLPPSTITPPITVPCPPRYLVAEWTTMSAPCSNGRMRYGVAIVLSTMRGTPLSWATDDTDSMSRMLIFGFPIVSAKNNLVLGRTAAAHSAGSSWFSTKVVSMPSLASVYLNRL